MTKATRFANRQVAEKMRSLRESWERSGSDLDWLELLQAKYRVGGLSKADMADVFVFLDELRTQLTEARAVLRDVTWVRADQVPIPCFHPADAHRWAFCVACGTWSRADQPNDPAKLHAPDCRLDKALNSHP